MPRVERAAGARAGQSEILLWRIARLRGRGFSRQLAEQLADDRRWDLHGLLELVDRGCPAELALRILRPLDEIGDGGC
jgi:hypothetical protein